MWLKRKYFIELRWSRKIGPEIGSRGWDVWGRGWRRGNKSYLESSSFSPSKADEQNWNNEKINEKHKGCIKCGQNWTTMNFYVVDDMADFASKLRAKMTPKGRTHTLTPLAHHQNNELKQQIQYRLLHLTPREKCYESKLLISTRSYRSFKSMAKTLASPSTLIKADTDLENFTTIQIT